MNEQRESSAASPLRPGMLVWIVAILGAAVFIPAIAGGWIYDDHPLIGDNPYVHSFHEWTRWFTRDFWDVNDEIVKFGNRMIYWRPLVSGSYAVDWKIGGGSPLVFHLMNTLWQAIASGLAFVVLRRWIGSAYPAFVAALLFAVHPTKAESVAWIAGRTDVLCIVALLLAANGMARRLDGRRFGIALEAGATVFAYLCKEQAIVLPAFAAVEAWVAMKRPPLDFAATKRIVLFSLPQAVLAIGYYGVRAVVMPISAHTTAAPPAGKEHLLSVLDSFGRFFTMTIAPYPMSIQHGLVHSADRRLLHSTPHIVVGALGIAAVTGLAWLARRRFPVATVGIGFFFVTIAPTSNIVYTQMATLVSERFLYVPMLGVALVIGGVLAVLSPHRLKIGYALATLAIVALGAISIGRSRDYGDERRFWQREVALHPDSHEGRQYMIGRAVKDKRFYDALAALLELKQANDKFDVATSNSLEIAVQVAELSPRVIADHDTASLRAIDAFADDLQNPESKVATLELPFLHFTLSTAGAAYPKELDTRRFRLYALRADIQSRLGNDAKALELSAGAMKECAGCVTVINERALTLARAGQFEEARTLLASAEGHVPSEPLQLAREHVEKAMAAHVKAATATGPAQLQARASELAALELWGRAYDVLAPYKEQIKTAPGVAQGFAELAFRAGDSAVAREVLGTLMPATEIDTTITEWTKTMGWVRTAR